MQQIINYFVNASKIKLFVISLITLIIVGVIIVASLFAWDYFVTQKVVTLIPSPGTTITIGEQYKDEPTIKKEIASTNTLKEIRLLSGSYVVKFTGSSDYQAESRSVYIKESTEIKTPALKYTDEKLSQLLIAEKPSIQNVITPILPNPGYQIDNATLFDNGSWYGTRLKPSIWYDPVMAVKYTRPTDGTEDMLRVILKKENDQWKLMAGPSLIFAIDDYPEIPQDVIRSTNKLGFN